MQGLYRRIAIGAILGVVVLIGFSLYADVNKLAENLIQFSWRVVPLALALAFFNYAVRFIKWSLYLSLLGLKVPLGDSAVVFMSGLVMSITPGKVGELLKSYLLRESKGIPMARTAPVVIAERLTDVLALLALATVGIAAYQTHQSAILAGFVVVLVPIAILTYRPLSMAVIGLLARWTRLKPLADRLAEAYDSMRRLVTPGPLVAATALSVLSWFAECVAFYLILNSIGGVEVPLRLATFIYAASTILGVPSPGGLGLTEGGMVGMTMLLGHVERQAAVTATLVVRLCTLWFAVAVGLTTLLVFRKRTGLVKIQSDTQIANHLSENCSTTQSSSSSVNGLAR